MNSPIRPFYVRNPHTCNVQRVESAEELIKSELFDCTSAQQCLNRLAETVGRLVERAAVSEQDLLTLLDMEHLEFQPGMR